MFRLVFSIQLVVYLIVAPISLVLFFGLNGYLILWGLAAALSFAICAYQPSGSHCHRQQSTTLKLRSSSIIAIIFMTLAYMYVVIDSGLLNRRQGSEFMALMYANLPPAYLLILRVYEILLIPLMVVIFLGANNKLEKTVITIIVGLGLPFIGVLDSRGRLLVLALAFVSLVGYLDVKKLITNKIFFISSVVVAGALGTVSFYRSLSYANFSDFIYVEFLDRLNGTNLLSRLQQAGKLPNWGTFDFGIFSPIFLRFMPFSDEGEAYKAAGMTSSKQYILANVLHSKEIDHASSLITDPAYFGGFFGVIVVFGVIGALSRFIDIKISNRDHMQSRLKVALYCSLVMAFLSFEADFLGAISNFFLFSMILIVLAFLGLERVFPRRLTLPPR